MERSESEELIARDFVRGLRTWRDLEHVGLSVSFMDDGCDCDGDGLVVIAATAKEVAEGIARMRSGTEVEFRRWASALLAASAVVDLASLETHEHGETLLNALWDASSGEVLDPKVVSVVHTLAKGGPP
jgi:hypothetical protein